MGRAILMNVLEPLAIDWVWVRKLFSCEYPELSRFVMDIKLLLDEHEWARPLHKLDMFGVPYLVQGPWVIQRLDLYHGKTQCNAILLFKENL